MGYLQVRRIRSARYDLNKETPKVGSPPLGGESTNLFTRAYDLGQPLLLLLYLADDAPYRWLFPVMKLPRQRCQLL